MSRGLSSDAVAKLTLPVKAGKSVSSLLSCKVTFDPNSTLGFCLSVREVRSVNLFFLGSFCSFVFHSAYCGGLWLASLCVTCKMARLMGDGKAYQHYRDNLDRGSAAFDKLLWNGKKKKKYV